jgi:cytochrome P450
MPHALLPGDLPRLADASWMGTFGLSTRERLSLQRDLAKRDTPLVRGRVLQMPVYFPCTPDAAHDVLVTHAKSFEKSPGLRIILHHFAGQGLFTSEGAVWRTQRRLMSPLFQPATLSHAGYAELMRRVAIDVADSLTEGATVDVAHETTRIAMNVVGKTLFDIDAFDDADDLSRALTTALGWVNQNLASPALVAHVLGMDAANTLAQHTTGRLSRALGSLAKRLESPFLLPGVRDAKLRDAVALVDARIAGMIAERRKQGLSQRDLLTLLISAKDPEATGDDRQPMSDQQVRDEAITLFVAGHETTATALAWSFYYLARDPDLYARALAEARAFADAPITTWEPQRLELCTRIFKESMRLVPPLMMLPRRSLEAVEVAGTLLPPRSIVFVSVITQHYRADVYPDPERFDPDRWLPAAEAKRPRSSYLPFGAGPRVCIGQHFAMMEGPIVLATLLARLRFEIDPERIIEPDDFATLRPRGGVPAIVRRA